MKLHRPTLLGIKLAEEQQHEGGELRVFLPGDNRSDSRLLKDARGNSLRTKISERLIQTMIGKPAAVGMKIVATSFQCLEKIGQAVDPFPADFSQPVYPVVEFLTAMDGQRFVRSKRGQDLGAQPGLRNRLVMTQVIKRIVSGAEGGHQEFLQDALRTKLWRGDLLIGCFPN